ncbi:pyridoxamine kinase [Carnobacterium pleistocenium]|uniref:pyridoxamine kinase n=1 Tax=Carnobacterium pleistocenium TaxID=181073 RepID=UPI00068A1668|nr:pyridoxamine kinase [Carnobacterium pleistocenium]
MKQPRILVIQDISASCRISMNVAVPILSCLENWVSVLPTALLSTHTGKGFEGYTFLDLSAEISIILNHWRSLGIKFDGIVIGYLSSVEQMKMMKTIITQFTTEKALIVLDPVMGDHGSLYPGFTSEHVEAMRELCQFADVLIPNVTEAYLLAGITYPNKPHTKEIIEPIINKLTKKNKQSIVISGVTGTEKQVGAAFITKDSLEVCYVFSEAYPGHFDGVGDLFTSVIAGFLFQQHSLRRANEVAVNYISKVVKRTIEDQVNPLYGITFEKDLLYLMEELKK